MPKTVCVDFDGVLHRYDSGWQGINVIGDPPVGGAIQWLRQMLQDERFDVCIYSSRSKDLSGIFAMRDWLQANGLYPHELSKLQFPMQKPAAFVTLDDRAVRFTGVFPTPDEIDGFQPWNKGGLPPAFNPLKFINADDEMLLKQQGITAAVTGGGLITAYLELSWEVGDNRFARSLLLRQPIRERDHADTWEQVHRFCRYTVECKIAEEGNGSQKA